MKREIVKKMTPSVGNTQRIVNEPFFEPTFIPIEAEFKPLDQSIIWQINSVFWKNVKLWQKTYNEHYESVLPSGLSESHRSEFIKLSAKRFFRFLKNLQSRNVLPAKIYVYEKGPGTGKFAKRFLDYMYLWSSQNYPYYERMIYIMSDISNELLKTAASNLHNHKEHIKLILKEPGSDDLLREYVGKILFARHSNLWDQLPCRMFKYTQNSMSEILVQAVLDTSIANSNQSPAITIEEIAKQINAGKFEDFIVRYPQLWKSIMRAIKLKIKIKRIHNDQKSLPHVDLLSTLGMGDGKINEFILSTGVLEDLSQICSLIDWDRQGYIEIMDLVIRDVSMYAKDLRLRKFDGALSVPVNGPLLREYMARRNKHTEFKPLRGLNTIVTIRNASLEGLLSSGRFVTMAEIAPAKDQPSTEILKDAESLFKMGVDCVSFSDQAHGWTKFMSAQELVERNVFGKLPGSLVVPVLASRRKSMREIANIKTQLEKQNVRNLFVVTGDLGNDGQQNRKINSSLDIIPKVAKDFFTGAVAHPRKDDINYTLKKIRAGAKFLIMQSTYDHKEWKEWYKAIQENEIHKTIPIIASVIPIISHRTLSAIQELEDVNISSDVVKSFSGLKKEEIKAKGIFMAKSLIKEYRKSGIFAGIYIYSKSADVIKELIL